MKKRSPFRRFSEDVPLRAKFLILFIPMVLSAVLISVFLMFQMNRAILQNSLSSEEALTSQTANVVIESLQRVTTVMDSLTSDPFLSRATYTENPHAFLRTEGADTYADNFFTLANSMTDQTLITDIKVYLNPEYEVLVDHYEHRNILTSLSEIKSSYWYGIFSGQPTRTTLFCPSFYLTNKELEESGSLCYIQKYNNIASPTSTGTVAYLAVYFSQDRIEQLLRDNRTTEDSLLYIVNSREAVVATTDRQITGIYFQSYEDLNKLAGVHTHFKQMTILGENVYLTCRGISPADWQMVCIIPKNSVYSGELSLFVTLSVILLTVFMISVLLLVVLTNSLSGRITKVTKKIAKNERIHPAGTLSPGKDEVAQLARAYDEMHDQINDLMQEQQTSAEKLRMSEAKALQAQINPHFLYNILDMMNWQIMSGDKKAASEAVLSLSQYYKMTLSKADIPVPVRDEVKHVELYVKLQNMRFEGRIQFLSDVPDELLDLRIPKLVLQPIVENAVLHGIQEKEQQEGTIIIMGWKEENDLVFTVSDDGVGIEPDVLSTILDQNAKTRKNSGTNIAVYNTHLRLQLLYGEHYGLTFRSVPGEGTEVEIRVPEDI